MPTIQALPAYRRAKILIRPTPATADNHKPDTNPSFAKLRVAGPSKYDLSYNDNGIYKYQGSRTGDGGQYVLIFDPSREAFVLHKVDSLFTMNLTQTPNNTSAARLKQEHPHLTKPPKVSSGIKTGKPKEGAAPKPTTAPRAAKELEKEPVAVPEPAKAAPKKPTPPSDQEEDSDDDDGGLVMEFPGGEEPSRDFSPAFPPRRFSEFVAQEEDEEDADGEDEEDEMSEEEHFKLPSPMNFHNTGSAPAPAAPPPPPPPQPMQVDAESEEDGEGGQQEDEELEIDDLEAELVAELEGQAGGGHESESDVSEED